MEPVRICETVSASTMAELRRRRDAVDRADIVEVRLDGVTDVDVAGSLAGRRKPVVVTCRPSWDGGRFEGPEEVRLGLLAEAVRLGADYVDVEHAADWRRVPRAEGTALILSFHDWRGAAPDLADRVRQMRQAEPDVVKIAVTAARLADCLTLRAACSGTGATVAIAMGVRGQITRICPWKFNSIWTYSGQVAPGQMSTGVLTDRYRVARGSETTAIYGLAGSPVSHSASPAMHNAAFAAVGLDAVYVPLDGETVEDVDRVASALDVRGLSVTAPFKREFLSKAASADERAKVLGAVNTLRRAGEGWDACNVDVDGFLGPLDELGCNLAGLHAVVLGAGGAARAVAYALRERGARVAVAARNTNQARALADGLGVGVEAWPPGPGWEMLVNTTPVGTWPDVDASPLPPASVRGALVYDLVYNPSDTALMRHARAGGARTIGGLEMLVGQACRQFEWWTGRAAPRSAMRQAALEFVSREVREGDAADHV